jgi:hypothetical protein
MYKVSSEVALNTSSNRRITLARWRRELPTSSDQLRAKHRTIASTKACSTARATSGFRRISGAARARWIATLCSFRNLDKAAAGGATRWEEVGGTNSHPVIVSPRRQDPRAPTTSCSIYRALTIEGTNPNPNRTWQSDFAIFRRH